MKDTDPLEYGLRCENGLNGLTMSVFSCFHSSAAGEGKRKTLDSKTLDSRSM